MKQKIHSAHAPTNIGTYSQAIKAGGWVFISGQIPLVPATMEIVDGDFKARARRTFENLQAVAVEAGATLSHIVKLTIYLTDMANAPMVNEVMAEYMHEPYPARAMFAVSALPKEADIEIEGIMVL